MPVPAPDAPPTSGPPRAGVSRQLDRGVTVSLLGTLHRDVAVETAPVLSPAEAARHIALATGEAPAALPRLVIVP